MTIDEMIALFSVPFSRQDLKKWIAGRRFEISSLISLSQHPDGQIAFRSSWILDHIVQDNPKIIIAHIPEFLQSYIAQKNLSCKREFTRIFMEIDPADSVNSEQLKQVLEVTGDWLIDPATPVAVKVNCIDILYAHRGQMEWIGDELMAQIEYLLQGASPAMLSRGKRILKKLHAEKTKLNK